MPDYSIIRDHLLVVSRLSGKKDELLHYLLEMAMQHCAESQQNQQQRKPDLRVVG